MMIFILKEHEDTDSINIFPTREKGLGMTWRNTQGRRTFSCLIQGSSSYRHENSTRRDAQRVELF